MYEQNNIIKIPTPQYSNTKKSTKIAHTNCSTKLLNKAFPVVFFLFLLHNATKMTKSKYEKQ